MKIMDPETLSSLCSSLSQLKTIHREILPTEESELYKLQSIRILREIKLLCDYHGGLRHVGTQTDDIGDEELPPLLEEVRLADLGETEFLRWYPETFG